MGFGQSQGCVAYVGIGYLQLLGCHYGEQGGQVGAYTGTQVLWTAAQASPVQHPLGPQRNGWNLASLGRQVAQDFLTGWVLGGRDREESRGPSFLWLELPADPRQVLLPLDMARLQCPLDTLVECRVGTE